MTPANDDDDRYAGIPIAEDEPARRRTSRRRHRGRRRHRHRPGTPHTGPFGEVEWIEVTEEVAGQYDLRQWRDHP